MQSFCRLFCGLILSCSLFGCASAGEGQGPIDGGINITPDALSIFDARPGTPDGPPGPVIDSAPGTPDAPPPMACVMVPQSGCLSGQACDLDPNDLPNGGTQCRPVTANGTESSTCANVNECSAGYVCLGNGTTSSCSRYCNTDLDCTAPGGLCLLGILDGNGNQIPGVTTCSKNCSPINSAGCPTGYGCHIYTDPNNTTRNLTDCDPAGTGGRNATCANSLDCQTNFTCVNTGTLVCRQNCVFGSTCTFGACIGFNPPAIVGGVTYGVCP